MFYIVLAADRPNMLDRRMAFRQQHVNYWVGLGSAVKVAGAMLSGDGADAVATGSSFLLEAPDEATVRSMLAKDPFTVQGVFRPDVTIQPVRPAIGVWHP